MSFSRKGHVLQNYLQALSSELWKPQPLQNYLVLLHDLQVFAQIVTETACIKYDQLANTRDTDVVKKKQQIWPSFNFEN